MGYGYSTCELRLPAIYPVYLRNSKWRSMDLQLEPWCDPDRLNNSTAYSRDPGSSVEHDQPTFATIGLLADAQEVLIPGVLTLDDDVPSLQGRYASFAPLDDGTGRMLVAWSQCRLIDEITDPQAAFEQQDQAGQDVADD